MRRKLKTRYAVFLTAENVRTENFLSLLRSPRGQTVFNDKFFESVEKYRNELNQSQQKLFLFQLPIFIFLVLILTGTEISLNVLGITVGKNLREVMVVISAALGLGTAWLNNEKTTTQSILKAQNIHAAHDNKEVLEYLNAGKGLSPMIISSPTNAYVSPSGFQVVAMGVFIVASLTMFVALIALMLSVHIGILIDIYRHPNFSSGITAVVISFVILSDTLTLSWHGFTGLLPYTSRERLAKWHALKEKDPDRYDEVLKKIARDHLNKPLPLRWLTRPKLPRDV